MIPWPKVLGWCSKPMWVIPWVMLVDVTEPCCGHGSEFVVNLHSNLKCMHSTRYSMELHCPGAQVFTEHWTKKYYFFLQKVLHCLRMGVCCFYCIALHHSMHCPLYGHVTVVTLHCPLPCYTTSPWGASVYQGAIRGGPAPPCHPRPRKSFLFQISWW